MHSYLVVINSQVHMQLYIPENYFDIIFCWLFSDKLHYCETFETAAFFLHWPEYSSVFWLI